MQALSDATTSLGEVSRDQRSHVRMKARNWFRRAGRHFQNVCALADLDPPAVQARAVRLIDASGILDSADKEFVAPKRRQSTTTPRARTGGRVAKLIEHDGLSLTIPQWAARLGLTPKLIRNRLSAGHPTHLVLSQGKLPAYPGGRSRLSEMSGDRRGEANARVSEIGVFTS